MRMNKASRYALVFASVGIVIVALILSVQRNIIDTYETNLPYIRVGDEVRMEIDRANLALERALANDAAVRFESDVQGRYNAALLALQHAFDGDEAEGYSENLDEETRAIIRETMIAVEDLSAQATRRWESRNSSPGFTSASREADELINHLVERLNQLMNQDTRGLRTVTWLTTSGVFLAFSFFVFLIYRLQQRTDRLAAENEKKLSEESSRVETLTQFIEAVSAGNYNIELDGAAATDDNLTATLIKMRDKLRDNAEDDRKRNWTTTGLAQVGEILRAGSSSAELYDNIIRFVVKYTKSNQGGLFILQEEDEDRYLELVACYAFERKKYLTKRIEVGDGLVGQCFVEGEKIYLLEVPEEYVNITSGLGGSNPNALLLVPLKINDQIYGVIELASFNAFQDFEIALVEKLAESIASTISNVRVNETTRILLERTQQQAEEMKSQEEEIRQNMEELEATQEEMRRKQAILEKELEQSQHQGAILREQEKRLTQSQDTLQAIVDNIPRAIFWKDPELRFMGCNRIFAEIAGASSPAELIGKSDFDMAWKAQADAYRKDDLEVINSRKSKLDIEEVNINSDGEESWVRTSKVPIINKEGAVVAILGMFEDITERKKKEADIAVKLRERDEALKELAALKQLIQSGKV